MGTNPLKGKKEKTEAATAQLTNQANTKSGTAKKYTAETTGENNQGQERDCLAKDSKGRGQM
jgi:hypothetical protein